MNIPYHNNGFSQCIDQLKVNGCRWLGNFQNELANVVAGQTFQIPRSGRLETISIYCEMVHRAGKVKLSFHRFDDEKHDWGPELDTVEMEIAKLHDPKWLEFKPGHLQLDGKGVYGFRLQTNDALVALGEAIWGTDRNELAGEEWIAKGNDSDGHYYRYFSLVYSVGIS